MKFPPIKLDDLDKDRVKTLLELGLEEIDYYKYVCVAISPAGKYSEIYYTYRRLRQRILDELGSQDPKALQVWAVKHNPDNEDLATSPTSQDKREEKVCAMHQYRIDWLKHMLEQIK